MFGDKLDVSNFDVPLSEFTEKTQTAIREQRIPTDITEGYEGDEEDNVYQELSRRCPFICTPTDDDDNKSAEYRRTSSTDASVIVLIIPRP